MSIPNPQTPAEKDEDWREVGKELFAGGIEAVFRSEVGKGTLNTVADVIGALLGIAFTALSPIGIGLAKAMSSAEDFVAPAYADMAAAAASDLFGVNVDGSAFAARRNRGGRSNAASALGRGLMDQIRGQGGSVAPSDEPAARWVSFVVQMALEGWYSGWFFEVLSSLVPQLDIGKIESYGELDDIMAQVLGLGRITRSVLRPIVDATVVTPLEWQTNKTYRPRLLMPGEVTRQVARGRMTREQGIEELARQGYSNERIEALLNAQRKMFGAADIRQFVNRDHWSRDQGIQHLKDQGYDEQTAFDALRLEGLRRVEQLEASEGAAIISAYANFEIDAGTMRGMMTDCVQNTNERTLLLELAEVRRELGRPRLTLGQVEAMVKSGVKSVLDYRNAARDAGYDENDVIALELQLRYELKQISDIKAARDEALEERRLEAEAKAAAAERRRQELELERAIAQRGPIAKIEQAVIRGIVPIARAGEIYAAEYDAETVALLLELVEQKRLEYVAQQERAQRATQTATRRGLNVGELRAALFAQIITAADFRARLEQLGLDAGDADILTATAAAELERRLEASRDRDVAGERAAARRIDLARFETLVRRGARTIAQYDALLAELGFEVADRAALVELLELKIADDTAAQAERAAAAAALRSRGLSLEQFERAVILGAKTIDEYAAFLLANGFTADAQIALLAIARARLEEAEAARARRQASPPSSGGPALAIATVRRAARLGVISPDVYAARLLELGFDPDDVALDLELLLLEIADVQAARARRDAIDDGGAGGRLSLAQLARAVKRGLATIDDYRARAAELGYAGEELELVVALLVDELAQLEDARRRREQIDGELATRSLSLAQLEESVKKGFTSIDDFEVQIRELGYGADDAELLALLLLVDLEAASSESGSQ